MSLPPLDDIIKSLKVNPVLAVPSTTYHQHTASNYSSIPQHQLIPNSSNYKADHVYSYLKNNSLPVHNSNYNSLSNRHYSNKPSTSEQYIPFEQPKWQSWTFRQNESLQQQPSQYQSNLDHINYKQSNNCGTQTEKVMVDFSTQTEKQNQIGYQKEAQKVPGRESVVMARLSEIKGLQDIDNEGGLPNLLDQSHESSYSQL